MPASPHTSDARDVGFAALLSDPNLRRLWITQLLSSSGEALSQIAMPLLVYELTGSARMVGLIAFMLILPRVVLAPITGMLADRLNKRRLMIVADVSRMALVSLVPFAGSIWQLGVLAVAIAVGNAAGRPAELAAVPLVAGKARLVPALSLVQVSNGIIRIAVPAAGAGIISAAGPAPVFWVQALCFAGSLVALRRLIIPANADEELADDHRDLLRAARDEMWAGLRIIRDVPIVRGVTVSEALFQIAFTSMTIAGLIYTSETLDLGDNASAAFALMTTFLASGVVVGASVASRIAARIGRPTMMALGYTGPFLLTVAFLEPGMPVIYAAWFVFGFLDALAVISFQAYLAEATADSERGKMYAAWGAVVALASALAYYAIGWITPWLGAPLTLAVAGAFVGISAPISLWVTGALQSVWGSTDSPRRSRHE